MGAVPQHVISARGTDQSRTGVHEPTATTASSTHTAVNYTTCASGHTSQHTFATAKPACFFQRSFDGNPFALAIKLPSLKHQHKSESNFCATADHQRLPAKQSDCTTIAFLVPTTNEPIRDEPTAKLPATSAPSASDVVYAKSSWTSISVAATAIATGTKFRCSRRIAAATATRQTDEHGIVEHGISEHWTTGP